MPDYYLHLRMRQLRNREGCVAKVTQRLNGGLDADMSDLEPSLETLLVPVRLCSAEHGSLPWQTFW